jgi:hypothetical protein
MKSLEWWFLFALLTATAIQEARHIDRLQARVERLEMGGSP